MPLYIIVSTEERDRTHFVGSRVTTPFSRLSLITMSKSAPITCQKAIRETHPATHQCQVLSHSPSSSEAPHEARAGSSFQQGLCWIHMRLLASIYKPTRMILQYNEMMTETVNPIKPCWRNQICPAVCPYIIVICFCSPKSHLDSTSKWFWSTLWSKVQLESSPIKT